MRDCCLLEGPNDYWVVWYNLSRGKKFPLMLTLHPDYAKTFCEDPSKDTKGLYQLLEQGFLQGNWPGMWYLEVYTGSPKSKRDGYYIGFVEKKTEDVDEEGKRTSYLSYKFWNYNYEHMVPGDRRTEFLMPAIPQASLPDLRRS